MNVLFVPSLGLDLTLLERLAASVDYPVKYKVAWNNGPVGALEPFRDAHPDWIIKDSPIGNRGVAGSWNECAKWFSAESCWLLMNEDAWFLTGQLERISAQADLIDTKVPVMYLNDSHAYYCFLWTQAGRDLIGEFDENLWPAYYEDYDYRVRLELARPSESFGIRPNWCYGYPLQGEEPVPHGKPRAGGTDYAAMIQGCGLLNRAYWRRKWGGEDPPSQVHGTPYNDQRLTFKDWVWYPEERAKRHPLWETFINAPHPSIYD